MRLDEAFITATSVQRLVTNKKASFVASFVGGVALATIGMSFGVTVAGSMTLGYLASYVDRYLVAKKLPKQLENLKILADKRDHIVKQLKKVARNDDNYKKAVTRTLELIKHDIDSISNSIVVATIKAIKKHPESESELKTLIKLMHAVVKKNARPLYESTDEVYEALEILPASFVGLVYLKDKFVRYGYMKYIKRRYEQLGESPEMFPFIEPYVWKYMKETSIQYYRDILNDREFAEQSILVMKIIKTKDVSILFNDK